jgi:hypothetical protein
MDILPILQKKSWSEITQPQYPFVFTLFFFLGAFLIFSLISRKHPIYLMWFYCTRNDYFNCVLGFSGTISSSSEGNGLLLRCFLRWWEYKIFGNQNSQSTVRINPFNRAFTDLGIELSQLFFYKTRRNKKLKPVFTSIIDYYFLFRLYFGIS